MATEPLALTRTGGATLYGDLAEGLYERLEQEGHDLAPVAREVLRDVLEHDREKLAHLGREAANALKD